MFVSKYPEAVPKVTNSGLRIKNRTQEAKVRNLSSKKKTNKQNHRLRRNVQSRGKKQTGRIWAETRSKSFDVLKNFF